MYVAMKTIILNGETFQYTVHRQKNRKTIGIKLIDAQQLTVTIPLRCTLDIVTEVLEKKSRWITTQSQRLKQLTTQTVNQHLVDGAQLLYQGRPLTLRFIHRSAAQPIVRIDGNQLVVTLMPGVSPQTAPPLLRQWYIQEAGRCLQEKTHTWAKTIGVQPQQLTIKDQKSRWGSCSSIGNINYNWRIIMAPPAVIDYLIIHELCHLREPNHSPRFWNLVTRFSPAAYQHRQWLKENGTLLFRVL